MGQSFRRADAGPARRGGVIAKGAGPARLVQGSGGQHQVQAAGQTRFQPGQISIEHQQRPPAERGAHGVFMPPGEGAARAFQHFQSPHDALAVIGVDARRVRRVGLAQLGVQSGRALGFQAGFQTGADGRVQGRNIGNAAQQGLKIKARAAHQQRGSAARQQFAGSGRGLCRPLPGADLVRRGQKAVEMMRAGGALLRRGLGRDQRKIGIDLARVGVDHLAVQLARQKQGRGCFARTRGPGQADHRRGSRGGRRLCVPAHYETRKPPCGAARQGVPGRTSPLAYFSRRLRRTFSGTMPLTSAPWLAAALTMVELMNSHW